jgi:CheY-like chemotaxis protein
MKVEAMGAGIHVLVVDDNPQIRELLLESLRPLGNVVGCANASEATGRAAEQTPDLIVSDYRMPGLNGLELLAKLRQGFPHLAGVLLASRADLSGPLAGCSALVEELIEKPFFIEDATARIKRVYDRVSLGKETREAADSSSVRGNLAQMSVVDLLQTLDIGRKSCRLTISHDGQQCEMQFDNGQLLHAEVGDVSGEAAVYAVVAWTEGTFLIDFEQGECARTITHSTQSVLLEALRRFDESQRDSAAAETMCGAALAPVAAAALRF